MDKLRKVFPDKSIDLIEKTTGTEYGSDIANVEVCLKWRHKKVLLCSDVCDHSIGSRSIKWTKLKPSLIVVIRLMLSLLIWPKDRFENLIELKMYSENFYNIIAAIMRKENEFVKTSKLIWSSISLSVSLRICVIWKWSAALKKFWTTISQEKILLIFFEFWLQER